MSCVDLLPVETRQDRSQQSYKFMYRREDDWNGSDDGNQEPSNAWPARTPRPEARCLFSDLGIAPTASSKASLTALCLKSISLGVYCHPTTYVALPVPAVPAPDHLILPTVAHGQDDSVPTAISYDVIRQDTVKLTQLTQLIRPDYRNFLGNPTLLVKEVFPDEVPGAEGKCGEIADARRQLKLWCLVPAKSGQIFEFSETAAVHGGRQQEAWRVTF
ncbi:hypothetical protein B0H14DRAFT_3155784 [Mycena olivaceomarginata]|nr:hypothetical protein B0H14DRAFT_3155784 [Mycena olivaceomarginata]